MAVHRRSSAPADAQLEEEEPDAPAAPKPPACVALRSAYHHACALPSHVVDAVFRRTVHPEDM
eukprot:gene1040-10331_t